MSKTLRILAIAVAALAMCGCHTVDNNRIPPVKVYIPFVTEPEWNLYGVTGACQSKRFIKQERVPQNYPYTALSFTGFGGVLLCSDIHGTSIAYDLACPVEVKADVRVVVDNELLKARCPKCGSIYDIYSNHGTAVSGPAARDNFGLQIYHVSSGYQGEYRVVTQ